MLGLSVGGGLGETGAGAVGYMWGLGMGGDVGRRGVEVGGRGVGVLEGAMVVLDHREMGRRRLSGIAILARVRELSLQIGALVAA